MQDIDTIKKVLQKRLRANKRVLKTNDSPQIRAVIKEQELLLNVIKKMFPDGKK